MTNQLTELLNEAEKAKRCAPLLPPPGGDVLAEWLDKYLELLADLKAEREEVERLTFQVWISTQERLPTKPGLNQYEHIDCYICVDGTVLERPWNCEHECWDDVEYDDFEFDAHKPSHWMLRAPIPLRPQPPTDKDADNE